MILKVDDIRIDDQESEYYEEWGPGMINLVPMSKDINIDRSMADLHEYVSLNPHLKITLVISAKQGPEVDEEAQKKIEAMSD